jgi:hypothetical protein
MAVESVTPNSSARGDASQAPGDLLALKKEQLEKAKSALVEKTNETKILEDELKELDSWKARDDEQKTILGGAQKTIDEAREVLTEREAEAIDAAVKDYDGDLDQQEKEAREAAARAANAANAVSDAQAKIAPAQAAYDKAKDGDKEADARLKVARELLTRAERATASNELSAAYFFAREAKAEAEKAEVLSYGERDRRIKEARAALDKATADAATKQAEASRFAAIAAEFTKQLDADRKARNDLLLKTISRKFMAVEET